MISNITNTFIKAKKAFETSKLTESKNLLNEGISADRVIKVGSPLKEVFLKNKQKILKSSILKKHKLNKNNYFLVEQIKVDHRCF